MIKIEFFSIGPLKTTLVEFWEMLCQDQIQKIIMLTNLTEQAEVIVYISYSNHSNLKSSIYQTRLVGFQDDSLYSTIIL